MQRDSYIVELSSAQVSAGPYELDYRFPGAVERTFRAVPQGADTVILLVSYHPKGTDNRAIKLKPPPEHEVDRVTRLTAYQDVYTTLAVFTSASTSAIVVDGPIAAFKVVKTGTSATAYLEALA